MADTSNRTNTLRLSVTDRCNLRCVYCMPTEGIPLIPPREILEYEEIVRIVNLCVSLGIEKVRITGGEPLVRRKLAGLIERLAAIDAIRDLSLTTNGVLLSHQARELQHAGVHRVTVSMDSLRRDRYLRITGSDLLGEVFKGIDALFTLGIEPVKVNTVIVRGINDDEIAEFAALTFSLPIEVRFIERMPLGEQRRRIQGCGLWEQEGVPSRVILGRLEQEFGKLETASPVVPIPGPAKLYRIPSAEGRIGIISPVTEPFCSQCSRIRLTPEGKLRNCLLREDSLDLKQMLRKGAPDITLQKGISEMIQKKGRYTHPDFRLMEKAMVEIGG